MISANEHCCNDIIVIILIDSLNNIQKQFNFLIFENRIPNYDTINRKYIPIYHRVLIYLYGTYLYFDKLNLPPVFISVQYLNCFIVQRNIMIEKKIKKE